MPQRASSLSAGYSFTSWPAAPPVFEGVSEMTRLLVPGGGSGSMTAAPGEALPGGHALLPSAEGVPAALAPGAGRVIGERRAALTNGREARAVEFELTDAPDPTWVPCDDESALGLIGRAEPEQLPDWIEKLAAAGISADRHDSPNLLAQLLHAVRRPVDTILCTTLDADPSACLNAALEAWHGIELAAGVAVLARITRAGRSLVVTDARVPATWQSSLRRAARSATRIVSLVPDYPQSDPTLLLYTVLGRRLRPGRLPSELGVIQLDAAAAIAIGRLALTGSAMRSLPMVVRDHVLRQSSFVFVPVGMSLNDLLALTGASRECGLLLGGDALRDIRLPRSAIVSATGELTLHASAPEPPIVPDACVRCGWCVEACPTRVQPAGVLEAAQRADFRMAEGFGIDACIECGICTYVCPSRLPILSGIRSIRSRRMQPERATLE